MILYHVSVVQDEGWFIGRVLERPGIITQGKTLDELVFMVRDAISLMWGETAVQLELIIPEEAAITGKAKLESVESQLARPGTKLKNAAR